MAATAALLLTAAPAAAEEKIKSFKTTLIEANALGEAATITAAGVVTTAPSGDSFTIETHSGTDTVEVFDSTQYREDGVGQPDSSNVVTGDYVVLFGASSGSSVTAAEVSITPPEKPFPSISEFASGVVQAAPSGESFTIETRGGSNETVQVSPSTTYARARPEPGEESHPPTLADVAPGDYVGVSGPLSAVTAVLISTPQAGGHPDLVTSFSLQAPGAPEAAKNVLFDAPTGVFGNPRAITQCLAAEFALDQCSSDTQAGLITIHANYKGNPDYLLGTAPIFSIAPEPSETARFAFVVPLLDIPISIPVTVRTTSDYGLRFTVQDITQLAPLASAKLTLWGFPAEETHRVERFPKGEVGSPTGCPEEEGTACNVKNGITRDSILPQPLTDNPTTCTGQALTSTLEVETYAVPKPRSTQEATYPPIEGCENQVFKPVLQASPTTAETDSASGLNVDLKSPQFLTHASEPSEIKRATVTLPAGFTINPDAADGQTECKEPEAEFSSEGPAHCPDTSKIGTFSIGTPALPERLEGSVYLGEPKPGDQYRLFETASGFGMNIKFVGSVRPNPTTGQLTAEFPNLPQAPFEDFQLHLFSGERALMATPTACTIYTVSAEFYPWDTSQAEQESSQTFGLDEGPHGTECPGQVRPFTPSLEAGTFDATAGGFSSFNLKLNREDGNQDLGKLNFTLPPGLSANLHGVTYCPEADIEAAKTTSGRTEKEDPSCPASSQIGTTNVAAGPGTLPFHATGKIYFAGPFQGAPLSLVAITPALAGPYDYGTVVIRVALHVDPSDAHVTADSEIVPEIIGGIPLRLRSIQVNIERERFMINPTNCSAFTVGSEGVGNQGTAVAFSSPFQTVNCYTLPFGPKLTIAQLGGRKATRRAKQPSLQFNLNTTPGDANLRSVALTLPKSIHIDQEHLGNLCDRSELAADQCKGKTQLGTVIDETPLLEKPLEGPAYAVSGFGKLPHVVFILAGQVTVMPEGISTTVSGGRLRTVIPVIPDVPIGHFRLTLFGGSHGYLENTESLCGSPQVSAVEIEAQNGKKLTEQVKAKTACAAKKKTKRHSTKRHHRGKR